MRFVIVAAILLAATVVAQEYVSPAAQQGYAAVSEAAPAASESSGPKSSSSGESPVPPATGSSDNGGSQGAGYGAPAYAPVPEAKETLPPPTIEPIPFTPPPYEPVPIPGETSSAPSAPADTSAPPPPSIEPVPFTPPPYEPVPISSKASSAAPIPADTTAPPPPPPPIEPIPFTPPSYEPVPVSSKAPNAPPPPADTAAPPPAPAATNEAAPNPLSPPSYEPAAVAGEAAPKANAKPPQGNSAASPPPNDEIPVQREQVTPPAPVVPSECASDVLFVLDATGSVRKDYQNQKDFVKKIVETMNIAPSEQQVGLVLFSSKERQKIAFDFGTHENKTSVLEAIDDLPYYSGITAIGQALVLAKKALEKRRPSVKVYVIVVTDGFSYDTVEGPAADLRAVPGVTIFSAGVAQPSNESQLKEIAGDDGRVFIKEDSLQALVSAMACRVK